MKKIYNVLKIIFLAFIIFISLQTKSDATTINEINMDVAIDNYGNASVTEIWNATMTQNTEGYKTYKGLGNAKISDFTVTDETGTQYQSLSNWNVYADFNSKAYKCGLHSIQDGVELCWGISSYGNKTYTIKYNISNMVTQYTDAQGIYFNFINLDQEVGNVNITIHSNYNFSFDNSKIWAFGNDGTINFKDGKIVLNSGGKLSSSQYMVALIKFEENLFNTGNKSYRTFNDIYKSAMNGVSEIQNNDDDIIKTFSIIINFSIFIIFIFLLKKPKQKSAYDIEYAPLDIGDKIDKNEISYFRDIPCDGNLYYAYWIILKFNILKEEDCKNGLIGAILLDFIKKDYIKICENTKEGIDFKDNDYSIDLSNIVNLRLDNELEQGLIEILKQASGYNNILEAKEFENWCKTNYNNINSWFEKIDKHQTTIFQQKKLITETVQTKGHKNIITRHVGSLLRNQAIQLLGLKQFLLNYSLISERESIEVKLWEDYLIFAQLLGIAEKVEKQFSEIYPDFNKLSKINTEYTTRCTRTLSSSIIEVVTIETIEQEKRSQEALKECKKNRSDGGHDSYRDSGGGGSSYSGGGSSAGGSAGGGFR